MKHFIHSALLNKKVEIVVVGAGGSGSHVVNGLVQLHTAMVALGHPEGLHVTVVDDDVVSEANVGRQAFVWSDIGQPKATVLVNRLNQAFGLDWASVVARLEPSHNAGFVNRADIVIGCVDSRGARNAIQSTFRDGTYWCDLGNRQHDGQIVLGEIGTSPYVEVIGGRGKRSQVLRLPTVTDLFPETANGSLDEADDQPSCSLAEALEKQGLFVNRSMALHALNLLWKLFRYGSIDHHCVFVNMASDRVSPLSIDPKVWERFGYCIQEDEAA